MLNDPVNRQILELLQENARLTFSEIGRIVGLSSPAVAERVRRMEDAGIIMGYHATLNPSKIGLPLTAYLHVTSMDGRCDPIQKYAVEHPNVTECYCITGDKDILIKASFESVEEIEKMVQHLTRYGQVSSSLVLSTYLERRNLG